MFKYISFPFKCLIKKYRFLNLSTPKKARLLEKHGLFYVAGILYKHLKYYEKALECFLKGRHYRHAMFAYVKLGYYSKALEIADKKGYYKLGAQISERIQNPTKAAAFYTHYKPLYAARLYKKNQDYYKAGLCYLKAYQLGSAIDCFKLCSSPTKRQDGFKELEEVGIVLYFLKQYDEAFQLFIKLNDYYSALECAKALNEESLYAQTCKLISQQEATNHHYTLAAHFIEPYNPNLAITYYYLAQEPTEALRLLLLAERYEDAILHCFTHDLSDQCSTIANEHGLCIDQIVAKAV